MEVSNAHCNVVVPSAGRHIEGRADRDYQRDCPHVPGHSGLIRKYYGIAPNGTSIVGIYLWENKAAADALYTPDWVAMVTKRWGARHPCARIGKRRWWWKALNGA
jgi:hypothetical protein